MANREIITKRPYRHFKGKLYYVHDIAMNTETREQMVSYQALYEPYGMFVRSLELKQRCSFIVRSMPAFSSKEKEGISSCSASFISTRVVL